MDQTVIGVDPGQKGGYAIIHPDGRCETHAWDDANFVKDL